MTGIRRWPLHAYLLAGLVLLLTVQLVVGGLILRAGRTIAIESSQEGSVLAAQAAARNVELKLVATRVRAPPAGRIARRRSRE